MKKGAETIPSQVSKSIGRPDGTTGTFRRGKNWLLLIAINDYIIKPLHNCVSDAEALREVLTQRYTFEKSEIRTLYDQEASRANIHNVFRELIKYNIAEDDNIVIYYSGHGVIDDVTDAFCWVPIEAEDGDESRYVTKDEVISFLNKIRARHILLIADSCFSGTMLDSSKSAGDLAGRLEAMPSRYGLSSGRKELVKDGEPGEHSPFAESLLEVLRENRGALRASELGNEVIYRVAQVKKEPQTPRFERLEVKGHAGGEMVFHLRDEQGIEPAFKDDPIRTDILAHLPIQADVGYPPAPFKGLRWFEKEDARIFFGRKKEIRELFQLLDNQYDQRKRLTLLYGPSGTGKSSLLFAGLLPRMPADWQVGYKRRGQDGSALDILEQFSGVDRNRKSVLIIDQLEEIFSNPGPTAAAETEQFSRSLSALMEQKPGLSVILGFREEYLGRVNSLLNLTPGACTLMSISHLDRAGILEALTGVTDEAAGQYRGLYYDDPELPREIADDFIELDSKTHTPLIQYVLRKMWDEVNQPAEREPLRLTRALYQRMQRTSLAAMLETQLAESSKLFPKYLQNGLLNDFLYFFVTDNNTADAHTLEDLAKAYQHIPAQDVKTICEMLENGYLLSGFTEKDGRVYRLCHDALAPVVTQRYKGSQAPGQQASRFLETALRTGTRLSKEAVFAVQEGLPGRRKLSPDEEKLYADGLRRFQKEIIKARIRKNDIAGSIESLTSFFKEQRQPACLADLALLSFQDQDLEKMYRMGIVDSEIMYDIKTRIKNDLFALADKVTVADPAGITAPLREKIMNADIASAFQLLGDYAEDAEDPPLINKIDNYYSQWLFVQKQFESGYIDHSDYSNQINNINFALLEMANDILRTGARYALTNVLNSNQLDLVKKIYRDIGLEQFYIELGVAEVLYTNDQYSEIFIEFCLFSFRNKLLDSHSVLTDWKALYEQFLFDHLKPAAVEESHVKQTNPEKSVSDLIDQGEIDLAIDCLQIYLIEQQKKPVFALSVEIREVYRQVKKKFNLGLITSIYFNFYNNRIRHKLRLVHQELFPIRATAPAVQALSEDFGPDFLARLLPTNVFGKITDLCAFAGSRKSPDYAARFVAVYLLYKAIEERYYSKSMNEPEFLREQEVLQQQIFNLVECLLKGEPVPNDAEQPSDRDLINQLIAGGSEPDIPIAFLRALNSSERREMPDREIAGIRELYCTARDQYREGLMMQEVYAVQTQKANYALLEIFHEYFASPDRPPAPNVTGLTPDQFYGQMNSLLADNQFESALILAGAYTESRGIQTQIPAESPDWLMQFRGLKRKKRQEEIPFAEYLTERSNLFRVVLNACAPLPAGASSEEAGPKQQDGNNLDLLWDQVYTLLKNAAVFEVLSVFESTPGLASDPRTVCERILLLADFRELERQKTLGLMPMKEYIEHKQQFAARLYHFCSWRLSEMSASGVPIPG